MKSLVESLWLIAVVGTLFCGCGRNAPKPGVDPRAFDAAPPEIKQVWDDALAASAQDDPGSAISILRILSRESLSREQQKTVYDAIVFYEVKLKENAKRGDPAAIKAMETLGYGSVTPNH